MIFSGFLLNIEDIPKYFLFMRYLSWFSYANENLIINQFSKVKHIECDEPDNCNEYLKRFRNGTDVLEFFKTNQVNKVQFIFCDKMNSCVFISKDNFGFNMGCLVLLIVGWRVMTFLVLLIKSRTR
jgi:hypothetical protein